MAKNILIPTDFSIDSLQILKEFINTQHLDSKVNIIFGAGYNTSNSFSELLFISKSKIQKKLNIQAFDDAIKILSNKYADIINSTRIEFFTGWNKYAFNNFLEGNKIEQIIFSQQYHLKSIHKEWFDITPYLKKIKMQQTLVETKNTDIECREYIALSPLFSNS